MVIESPPESSWKFEPESGVEIYAEVSLGYSGLISEGSDVSGASEPEGDLEASVPIEGDRIGRVGSVARAKGFRGRALFRSGCHEGVFWFKIPVSCRVFSGRPNTENPQANNAVLDNTNDLMFMSEDGQPLGRDRSVWSR